MLQTLSLTLGILAFVGMIVGFFPCLGALNWINIPFAAAGLIVSIIAFARASQSGRGNTGALSGLILCAIAIVVGMLRLFIGGGIV